MLLVMKMGGTKKKVKDWSYGKNKLMVAALL
jgi:hypothetical protein